VTSFVGCHLADWRDQQCHAAAFARPTGVAVDRRGNLYVADTGNHCIRRVSAAGVVTTVVGSERGDRGFKNAAGAAARFDAPRGVAVDDVNDCMFVADTGNHVIRRVNLSTFAVSTLCGVAHTPGAHDGRGASASFNAPWGLALDVQGNLAARLTKGFLFVADSGNHTVRKVSTLDGR
jgi:DNA-binding beta-propeller fold protein YncE